MKTCKTCGQTLPLDGFYRDASNADGRTYDCRACRLGRVKKWQADNPERHRQKQQQWRDANRDKIRAARILREFNLTADQWDDLLASQGGRCAICRGTAPGGAHKVWHTDHDHATGEVRGILCHHCNVGLGQFRDDVDALRRAIDYLEGSRASSEEATPARGKPRRAAAS